MVGLRLFLPENWTSYPGRMARTRVPADQQAFRQSLSERGLRWAVGIPRHQKVYPCNVRLIFPVAGRGRPRQRHIPDHKSISAEATLAAASWRAVTRRRGTKGRLSARFAAVRVQVADGTRQRIRDMGGQQALPEDNAASSTVMSVINSVQGRATRPGDAHVSERKYHGSALVAAQ